MSVRGLMTALAAISLTACTSPSTGGEVQASAPAPPALVRGYAQYQSFLVSDLEERTREEFEIEDLITRCMKEQGFDYVAPTTSGPLVATVLDQIDPDLDYFSRDYRQQMGFGISTLWVYGIRSRIWSGPEALTSGSDVSNEYFSALMNEGGCQETALSAVNANQPAFELTDAEAQEEELVAQFTQRLFASEAALRADTAWVSCAQSEGYDQFSSVEDVESYFYDLVDPSVVLISPGERAEPLELSEEDEQFEEQAKDQLEEAEPSEIGDQFDYDLVRKVAAEEIRTASDLFHCEVSYYVEIGPYASQLASELGLD